MMAAVTLAATVVEAAHRFGDAPAFVAAGGWTLSFTELDQRSNRAAVALHHHGVRPGDVVALVLPSTPDYVVAYAAIAKLGAITTGINPRYTAAEQRAVLDVARPRLVLTTADGPDLTGGGRLCVIVTPGTSASTVLGGLSPLTSADDVELRSLIDELIDRADRDDPERLVTIIFTSGTTGTPKGAMFGNRELAAITTADVADRWAEPGTTGPAMLAATQFAHIGFMTKLPWYLRLATTTYILDRWRARDVLTLIQDTRMTSLGGVAPQMALMLREPTFDTYDVSSVETIVMGGALSPPALVHEARERFGARYSIRYSSTESGGIGLGTDFDADDEEALFTVGRPRGAVEAELRDDEDRPVGPGEVGELCLRSPYMMRGYWGDPETTADVLRGGWLHTGDLGRWDDADCLRLAGRKKEMFIRGGYNVYPVEVEAVLASHPDVADVAVVPRHDDVMGEIGVAVLVVRPGRRPPALDELRRFAGERLAAYKLPEAVAVVDALPLTAMQKLDRRALRDQFGGGVDHTG
jgi:acyl-CoA synthetase (AMP-forming)/AMP-acid ligase II